MYELWAQGMIIFICIFNNGNFTFLFVFIKYISRVQYIRTTALDVIFVKTTEIFWEF